MADFTVVVKELGVRLSAGQLRAITRFGTQHGGTLEVRVAGFGTIRLRDAGGQDFLVRTDGHTEPFD